MSVNGLTGPAGARNGMPAPGGYVYRRGQEDTRTGRLQLEQLRAAAERERRLAAGLQLPDDGEPESARPPRLPRIPARGPERVLAAAKAGITEADRRPRPPRSAPPAVAEPVAAPQPDPAPEPDPVPQAEAPPAAAPAPKPRRCGACGYLTTQPGHRLHTGGGS